MGRLEFTNPRGAWGGEATAFTPLLGSDEMLDYLGNETGIGPLTVIEVEHATAGKRSLDILAETLDGRRVAIENQYGVADHDHLTRGLAYAVASECAALIVIAEEHRDEFVSVADYLNTVGSLADEAGILVWLVKVRAVRRKGDEVWSPEFIVRAQPNQWEAAVRRETGPFLSSVEEFYAKCEAEVGSDWSTKAQEIVEDWQRLGFPVGHRAKKSVALYRPSPRQPRRGINALQLWANGEIVVCRGYLWQNSGAFDVEAEPTELDARIREAFPSGRWPDKGFYITSAYQQSDVSRFIAWLNDHFDAVMEHA